MIAERLPEPIEKGLPGPGLMAHVAVSKYADHLPLYRQEGILKRFGVELSRSTMCDWMAVAADLLEPIVKRDAAAGSCISKVIQTDDTPVKVQDHDGKGIKTGRLWVYHRRPRPSLHRLSTTRPTAAATAPSEIFKGYRGLSPGRCRIRSTTRLFNDRQDRRGRVHDARAAEVLRGADQRPGAVAPAAGVDRRALRRRGRREGEAREPRSDDAAWPSTA